MKRAAIAMSLFALSAGCRQDMQDQPRYKPLAASSFFIDGRSARPIPPGAVARDALNATDMVHTGWANGITSATPRTTQPGAVESFGQPVPGAVRYADTIPLPLNQALLERGRERFDIYCSPCHGYLGDGDGMVARRGFKIPPSLHHDRVRYAPPGYLFQVITNGYGGMGDYANQIPVEDRWAIVAYLRALELSRNATLADVPAPDRTRLEARP
jgi:mono/diheme cytochrome c family protein